MVFRIPINLGQSGLQYGFAPQVSPDMLAKALGQSPAAGGGMPGAEPVSRRAGADAYYAALSGTPSVESGNVIEALAAALEGGMAGRAANQERQRQDAVTAREDKREEASRNAYAAALEGYDPSGDPSQQMSAMVEALRGANPEAAFGLVQNRMGSQMDMADALSLENQRTPILAERQRQVGDIQVQQGIREAQATQRYGGGRSAPPAGYRWTQSGDLEAVPGGPADRPPNAAPLRGSDAAQMTRTREAAESARGLRGLVQEFRAHQQGTEDNGFSGTFPGAGVQVWDSDIGAMNALQARMTGLMRPAGSGATSDFEQRLYARGAPNVNNTPAVNEEIIRGIETLSDIADARQFFYEDYASAHGTLNGAERAFQQSPEFAQLTRGAPPGPPAQQRPQGQPRVIELDPSQ